MEETKKINLSAMMKKTGTEMENKELSSPIGDDTGQQGNKGIKLDAFKNQTPELKKPEIQKTGIKINIGSIKSEHKVEEVIPEVKKEVIKDEKTLYYESLTSNVLGKTKEGLIEKKKKINLKSIQSSEKNKKQSSEPVCSVVTDKEGLEKEICDIQKHNNQHEKNDLFSNYESDYKKKESKIIETIHKLKKIADIKKLTKTNKIFVVSIIMATVLGISFLFYIDPETHSLENYKASILTLAGREVTQDEIDTHQTDIENDIMWQLNQNNLGGYQLDFEILANENGAAIYKFDGLEYTTKEDLDIAITEKLQFLKKEKIKDYLKQQTLHLENEMVPPTEFLPEPEMLDIEVGDEMNILPENKNLEEIEMLPEIEVGEIENLETEMLPETEIL